MRMAIEGAGKTELSIIALRSVESIIFCVADINSDAPDSRLSHVFSLRYYVAEGEGFNYKIFDFLRD